MNRYKFINEDNQHCHTLDGKPLIGTSEVSSKSDNKPGLIYWAVGLALNKLGWLSNKKYSLTECKLNAGKHLETIRSMSNTQYYNLLEQAYKAHTTELKKTAESGIDLHALIEGYIKASINKKPLIATKPIVPFLVWCEKNVKRFLFSEVHCYSERLWCGGISDFAFETNDDKFILADIKSSKEAYFTHWLQLAAYDIQLSENKGGFDKDGNKVFGLDREFDGYAVFAERAGLDKPFFEYETKLMRQMFTHAIELYRGKMFWEESK